VSAPKPSALALAALLAGATAGAAVLAAPRTTAAADAAWYLARGRANLDIGNVAAAIEAYERAVQADPASREAARGLAVAYARNGDTDRAVAARDRLLARWPDDADLAFEQARVLQWSRYAYRRRDAARYLRMGLARRDDPDRRLELARLLARDRATAAEASAEYRRVLAARPGDDAVRREYLDVLLWDDGQREAAVAELERRAREVPGDERASRALARLLAADPRRAAEGAGRYAALAARHPEEAALHLGEARALVRAGRRGEARAPYERALARGAGADVRVEYADLLAGLGERTAADGQYRAALREAPGSRRARIAYARFLAARKETSRAAIAQYGRVVAVAPGDAEAHAGLARALAWNGDPDRALAHAELAERHGAADPGLATLERALRPGREPDLGTAARAVDQPGGAWALSGVRAAVTGSAEPTPFTRARVEGGWAEWSTSGRRVSGASFAAAAEWRLEPAARLDAEGGYDAWRLAAPLSGALRGSVRLDALTLSVAALRRPVLDSLRSAAGERVGGATAGAATENVLEASLARAGAALDLAVSVRAGAVTAASGAPNALVAGRGRALALVLGDARLGLSAGLEVEARHLARDASGLGAAPAPLAPRYFSPPLFASASPRLALAAARATGRADLEVGPAVQVEAGARAGVRAGGEVRASASWRPWDRLRLGASASAIRIAGAYTRAEAGATAAIVF
jgi:tetratricopeptide (TPR) repeat protein